MMYENINVVTIDCFIMYEEGLHCNNRFCPYLITPCRTCVVFEIFFFLIDHNVHVLSFIYDRQFKAGTVGSIKTAVRSRLFQNNSIYLPRTNCQRNLNYISMRVVDIFKLVFKIKRSFSVGFYLVV